MKEEKILRNRFGNENHFIVPKGYFDTFTNSLMGQLPEREPCLIKLSPTWWYSIPRRKVAAAACIMLIVGGSVGLYVNRLAEVQTIAKANMHEQVFTSTSESDFDEMADYAMLDSQAIYAELMKEN